MELQNARELEGFLRKHPDATGWVAMWQVRVAEAEWQNIQEVRGNYPSADGVKLKSGTVVTVFNVRGNTYRLLTSILYDRQIVLVISAMIHAEYDKQKWKDRL